VERVESFGNLGEIGGVRLIGTNEYLSIILESRGWGGEEKAGKERRGV